MSESTEIIPQRQSGFWAEIDSLKPPEKRVVAGVPRIGTAAPSSEKISLPNNKPTIIVFLRHCGCPFAEKAFKQLTSVSHEQPRLNCIAVSHSSAEATERWIPQVGGVWSTNIVVDDSRDIYAQWGLGLGNTWHISSPSVLYSAYRLGVDEGIWNRPTESGTRWQIGGVFSVDEDGIIRFAHVSTAANDLPDLRAAAQAVGIAIDEVENQKRKIEK